MTDCQFSIANFQLALFVTELLNRQLETKNENVLESIVATFIGCFQSESAVAASTETN